VNARIPRMSNLDAIVKELQQERPAFVLLGYQWNADVPPNARLLLKQESSRVKFVQALPDQDNCTLRGSLRRLRNVASMQLLAVIRSASLVAWSALSGSSRIAVSHPRPMAVAPTLVAIIWPRLSLAY
jgi:hypothetical protein